MIVVFDLDECIGDFTDPCDSYHTQLIHGKALDVSFTNRLRRYLNMGYLRPGITGILKVLYECKNMSDKKVSVPVSHIILMTNASNKMKWVSYISEMIDYHVTHRDLTDPPLFDLVLHRESPERTKVFPEDYSKYDGLMPKFLDDIYDILDISHTNPLVMFDDHPDCIVNSTIGNTFIIGVPEYKLNSGSRKPTLHETYELFMTKLLRISRF